jgi:hypothetical protein
MEILYIAATVNPGTATGLDTNPPIRRLLSRVEGYVVRAGLGAAGVAGQVRVPLKTRDFTTWLTKRERFEEG